MGHPNSTTALPAEPPAPTVKPKVKRAAPLNQVDVPAHTLKEALRVPEAIRDQFAKEPTTPLDLALALDMAPSGSTYRGLTGAAIAYGLIEGGAQATTITLTELGRRVVAPVEEGDDLVAMREAVLKPRVIREFLQKYDSSPLPMQNIAFNMLEQQLKVPNSATQRAYNMIMRNAEDLDLLIDIKGKKYVRLGGPSPSTPQGTNIINLESEDNVIPYPGAAETHYEPSITPESGIPSQNIQDNNRVFITHGKNHKVVDQIKKILQFGKFEAIVSIDVPTVAKPIPDKVMEDMRGCSAAIVHVGAERKLTDTDGKEHTEINSNVLVEVGAAMALYGRRFVLLVERGVTLPSNLQGLYEVRYEGEQLDHDATMKLLEAFNEFR
jgi:hypothetical protein